VRDRYATGSVTGDVAAGGLIGWNQGTITNSYFAGSVTGEYLVGGLVGLNEKRTVSRCYASGSVTGQYQVGGLVGSNENATVGNSFWDTETSGQSNSAGGTGKSTAEMKSIATFTDAGWDIIAVSSPGTHNPSHIWNIVNGVTYPFLSWQAV